jgi:hypothetical protein
LWAGSMVGSWVVSGFFLYSSFKGSVNIHKNLIELYILYIL